MDIIEPHIVTWLLLTQMISVVDVKRVGDGRMWKNQRPAPNDRESQTLPAVPPITNPKPRPHPVLNASLSLSLESRLSPSLSRLSLSLLFSFLHMPRHGCHLPN